MWSNSTFIRKKSFESFAGAVFSAPDPNVFGPPGSGSRIYLYGSGSAPFKAALHQLCDLATNKVRKKLAIYEDLTHICILSVYSVPPPCR
jgi:hypothetical protein